MKKPTQKQAWLKLARMWKEARRNEEGYFYVEESIDTCRSYGLCQVIKHSIFQNASLLTRRRMVLKISKEREKVISKGILTSTFSAFLWPWDEEGKRERIKFCRRMAKACR